MSKKGITVEGVMLEEYLKDNDELTEKIETEKLFKANTPTAKPYFKPRSRYDETIEKNGRVKILGQREINKAGQDSELIRLLKKKRYKQACFVVLLCDEGDNFITPGHVGQRFLTISEMNGIKIVKNLTSVCRWHIRNLLKTQLRHYLETNENKKKYKITNEGKDTLTFHKGYNLMNLIAGNGKKDGKIDGIPKFQKVNEPVTEKVETETRGNTPKIISEEKFSLDKLLDAAKKLENLITVQGDLNININIQR